LLDRFGLCKAIYDKYGPNIEIECNRVAKLSLKRQPVSGDCIVVRSGKIKPSFIINAVSPTPGQKNMEKVLKMTFENILKMVNNNPDIRTVAIPLLSTGKFLDFYCIS
jgi:O-acetyl-ADP-ribose deacetylase (regulator of RNase III)